MRHAVTFLCTVPGKPYAISGFHDEIPLHRLQGDSRKSEVTRASHRAPQRLNSSAPYRKGVGGKEDSGVTASRPIALPGMKIGLLGGSFDPPHAGHVHITRWALTAFRLDAAWWLVSPGNPLKADAPADMARRIAAAREIMIHPRVHISDLEARLGTRHTAQTVAALRRRHPGVHFVWLMGSDNLRSFHLWDRWEFILRQVPVGVLARPGEQLAAGHSPAARRFSHARLPQEAACLLSLKRPPAWTLVSGPMLDISSTALRRQGLWPR
jgi:nicotinate-nucleotide adenylyltransferase